MLFRSQAKGREWPFVFVPNLVEGELPLEGAEIEEVRTTYLSYYLLLTVNCSLLTPFVSTRVLTTYYSPLTTQHSPSTLQDNSDVALAYQDLIKRFLGEECGAC